MAHRLSKLLNEQLNLREGQQTEVRKARQKGSRLPILEGPFKGLAGLLSSPPKQPPLLIPINGEGRHKLTEH